jgi:hypothetical protein
MSEANRLLYVRAVLIVIDLTFMLVTALAQGQDVTPTDSPAVSAAPTAKLSLNVSPTNVAPTDKSPPLEIFLGRSKACPNLSQDEIRAAAQGIAEGKRTLPNDLERHRAAWLEYSLYFRRMYWFISISVIIFGALATALHDEEAWYRRWKTMAALLATIAAGANTALAPYADFKRFDQAFVVLNTARAQYETNPLVSLCDVGSAVAYGEAIIHKGE